nr:hypothetical protein [uncultured Brevundimonas sp.]
MTIIVPLAGPDFELKGGVTKAEILVDGVPLLRRCLDSRPWVGRAGPDGEEYVFVLRDTAVVRRFADDILLSWYQKAKVLYLGAGTQGAAFSALAGCALSSVDEPLIIDLADIVYRAPGDQIDVLLERNNQVGAIALTFESSEPCYSFIREIGGVFSEAIEKRVVSSHASVGTYIYKKPAIYMAALANVIMGREDYTVGGLHYVCPIFNGVPSLGLTVERLGCEMVMDVKNS